MNKQYEDIFFDELKNYFYENIERSYGSIKKYTTFNNFAKYYSNRPISTIKCLIPDCSEPPIYSHSISKNAILKNISVNGLVYTPKAKNDLFVMEQIGIEKQASVFPCLCNYHDSKYFTELDNTESKNYSEKFFEQLILRTIMREYCALARNLEMAEKWLVEIELGFEAVKSKVIGDFNNLLNSDKFKVKDWSDSRFSICQDKKWVEDKINHDKSRIKVLSDFYFKQQPNCVIWEILDFPLPVAFSGLTKFHSNGTEIILLINCLPYKDHTLFVIANSNQDAPCIKQELLYKYDLEDINSILELIEVLAVYGTDNIFFNINYWNSLDPRISNKYLQEFSNFKDNDPRKTIDFPFLVEINKNTKHGNFI